MSHKFLKAAQYSTHKFFSSVEDLSFSSRYDYEKDLKLMMGQLHQLGIQISNIRHLKTKHIEKLVSHWQSGALSAATIKNRMSRLRYVSKKLNKQSFTIPSNAELGLLNRRYLSAQNKAITNLNTTVINDAYVAFSLQLQKAFGLRREESIKFKPTLADCGDHIVLQGSWTKGGIERKIPITTQEQRKLLNTMKEIVPAGASLIPKEKSYRQQLNQYTSEARQCGMRKLHGLRHAYAQHRYKELTGWDCPKNNGPKTLSAAQKVIDTQVRFIISNEMGHSRKAIVKIYCG